MNRFVYVLLFSFIFFNLLVAQGETIKERAIQGIPEAQYNLGIAHIEGIGTSYTPLLAANFFEQAAQSGIMEAAYNLGLIHENGLLGNVNSDLALYWYSRSANQGSPEANHVQ